jgi:hypothetical protein
MKHIDLEHEATFKVGSFDEKAIVTANCTATTEKNVYDIRIVVKVKGRNRRRIHKGQIELINPLTAIEDVKEYMGCGDIVKDMLGQLSDVLIIDFPNIYKIVNFS